MAYTTNREATIAQKKLENVISSKVGVIRRLKIPGRAN